MNNRYFVRITYLILLTCCVTHVRSQSDPVYTLEECLNIALDKSYDAKRLEQSLLNSQLSLRAARAGLKSNSQLIMNPFPSYQETERQTPLPGGLYSFDLERFLNFQSSWFINQPIKLTDATLSVVASMQRFEQFDTGQPDVIGGQRLPTQYAPQLRLQLRQPVFTYNRLTTETRKAELSLDRTEQTYTRSQLDIVYNVTFNFYSLYQAQQQLQIDLTRLEQSETAYRIADLKQQAGLLAEVEVLRLEVDMETARNTAAASEARLRDTEDQFKVLIGLPIDETISVAAELDYTPVQVTLDKALGEALQRRTELRTDDIDVLLNRISITETDAVREIRGDLNLSYGVLGRDTDFADSFKNMQDDRRVTFSLTVPLWDWSKNSYEVQAAKANLENSRLTQQNRIEVIKQEVRAAVRNLNSAQQRVDITKRNQALAEKSYQISLLKFESGDLSTQDLALEQNRLSDAQTSYLGAVIDYKNALSDLRRKTLWDFERNQPVLVEVPNNQ